MTDWPVKTLGDVCEVIAGQSPEGKFYNKEGKGVPFYQGKKDFSERVLGSPTTWTSDVTKLARPGDILMSVRAPVGPVNLCPIEACIGRGLAAIRPSSKTDTDFIYYYLESIQSEIAGTEGAVFASINKAQIAGLRCPVPPLEEQKRIVALLDAATARVAELTACYEQARTHANNIYISALRDALEGNPDWPVKTLGDILTLSYGKPLEPKDRDDNGAIPVYGANGVKARSKRSLVSGPSIIVGRKGSAGELNFCDGPFWPLDVTYFVEHDVKVTDLTFLHYLLSLMDLPSLAKGVKPGINRNDVYALQSPVPPLVEQKNIVARLDSMKAKTSEMVAAYDAKLTAAKNLRQSILEAAFAGDL